MLAEIDTALRGATVALALAFAVVVFRGGKPPAARFGAVWGLCSAAYIVAASPALGSVALPLRLALEPVAAAAAPALWLFALSWFDDGFRPRGVHWLIAALFVTVDLLHVFVLRGDFAIKASGLIIQFGGVGFAVAAALAAWRGWRDDLVEQRRQVRNSFIILAAALVAFAAFGGGIARAGGFYPAYAGIAMLVFPAATFTVLVKVTGPVRADLFGTEGSQHDRKPAVGPPDDRLASDLVRLMGHDRAYRDPAISIGLLAAQLGIPEYRLRRHINGTLGFRNFAAYLAEHRLAEAKAALADPAQRDVSILTIALDTGYGSLPPFNRAFKAATGTTPTAYRRAALAAD